MSAANQHLPPLRPLQLAAQALAEHGPGPAVWRERFAQRIDLFAKERAQAGMLGKGGTKCGAGANTCAIDE
jgi:hypothetical protein